MPTEFDSFRFLGRFPLCPLPEQSYYGGSSTALSVRDGMIFWWLLKSLEINVSFSLSIDDGTSMVTYNRTEDLQFNGGTFWGGIEPPERVCNNTISDFIYSETIGSDVYNAVTQPFGNNLLFFDFHGAFQGFSGFFSPITYIGISSSTDWIEDYFDVAGLSRFYGSSSIAFPANPYSISTNIYLWYVVDTSFGTDPPFSGFTANLNSLTINFWT
jgi:hypothetical protein